MNRAVFLDRDGVLNRTYVKNNKSVPPACIEEFVLFPYVKSALKMLRERGFFLIVVTNQPDVGRNTIKKENVEEMHSFLLKELPLHAIEVCYDENSPDYKPGAGMLRKAAERFKIELNQSFMIGDRWRDIGAGRAAGCRTILVETQTVKEEKLTCFPPDFRCKDLLEASELILKEIAYDS